MNLLLNARILEFFITSASSFGLNFISDRRSLVPSINITSFTQNPFSLATSPKYGVSIVIVSSVNCTGTPNPVYLPFLINLNALSLFGE